MSAAEPPGDDGHQLLVVIDPVARRTDGESVRIAKDVLNAGAHAKISLPDTPEEFARALSRRGSRRPVVIGDDRALLRAVAQLHRDRELADSALALVPVGAPPTLRLAHSLGVPRGAVAAARTALDGAVHRLDLLVDDSDGVVLGGVDVPAPPPAPGGGQGVDGPGPSHTGVTAVWDTCRSLVRTLVRPAPPGAPAGAPGLRLRVEADGVLLYDLDRPVEAVTVASRSGRGLAEVVVRTAGGEIVRVEAKAVTVSGPDFRYRADIQLHGPVRRRTWTVRANAWGLMVPAAEAAA
ncbi:diacylglycerol kinase [Streptomyces sp. AM 2-1-1]|uniref:diacylglycerol kinase n=1 Tax=Streptomyces sp. AM 2-1-1 TaxID=3028709 RepID=UPI0023B8D7DD|nr:diacylglycerol kinase [Streptomyces sp. AM 2-1-1]WEH40544.1 diacylglycerol kinase [Streptomyces sp. AM 2-1-1]